MQETLGTLPYDALFEVIERGEIMIRPKVGMGEIAYKPHPFQLANWDRWLENRRQGKQTFEIWLKGRQPGATTDCLAGIIADSRTRGPIENIVCAHEDDTIALVWQKCRVMAGKKEDGKSKRANDKFLELPNGSRIYIAHEGEGAGRGGTMINTLFTEVDYWPNFYETLDALRPSVSKADPWSRHVMETTLKDSPAPEFRDFIERSQKGETGWKVCFISWLEDPSAALALEPKAKKELLASLDDEEKMLVQKFKAAPEQIAWRRLVLRSDHAGRVEKFREAYPVDLDEALLIRADGLFETEALKFIAATVRPPEFTRAAGTTGGGPLITSPRLGTTDPLLEVWEQPEAGQTYYVGADAADATQAGTRGSESFACVVNANTGAVCAQWHGHCDVDTFANALYAIGHYYNVAQLIVELDSGAGFATVKDLNKRLGYPRIYTRKAYDQLTGKHSDLLGFRNNEKGRQLLVSNLKICVNERRVLIPSAEMHAQLRAFSGRLGVTQRKQSRPGQIRDDGVMALALATVPMLDLTRWAPHDADERQKPVTLDAGASTQVVSPLTAQKWDEYLVRQRRREQLKTLYGERPW